MILVNPTYPWWRFLREVYCIVATALGTAVFILGTLLVLAAALVEPTTQETWVQHAQHRCETMLTQTLLAASADPIEVTSIAERCAMFLANLPPPRYQRDTPSQKGSME
jgi:hypothetical protein